MLPAVALVGRPNVGKSTLFNRLTSTRDALVADYPGVTRDRRYGYARHHGRTYVAIDTGGLGAEAPGEMQSLVEHQVDLALDEADAIVFVVDHKDGLTAEDERIAQRLRRSGKPVTVAINKAEGADAALAEADFFRLGFGRPFRVAALHGQGIAALLEAVLEPFAPTEGAGEGEEGAEDDAGRGSRERGPTLAVIGRPNVGKSTLINRLIGQDRLVTSAEPGTTRDSIVVPCERDGRRFSLIDTAGIRRRARVSEAVEKYSIVQSLQAIEDAGVVIALLDAREGVTDQDTHLIGLTAQRGRALVIGINKWDGLSSAQRGRAQAEAERRLDFVPYAKIHHISALHGSGIAELVRSALAAYDAAGVSLPTPRLNQLLKDATTEHAPPMIRGRQVRLRYAHQGGRYPPIVVVHGTQAERVPAAYKRYLENRFREALRLEGTPIRVELKSGDNPFAGRRNKLTPRQRERRRRVIKHARRGR
ncbi:MAG: ribosome biogenesis GTPase Der [Gammaproteobacteria bacterium]|nr:ribosome biogenesis GTPase Der [Gammaproteobacteria bacterium]